MYHAQRVLKYLCDALQPLECHRPLPRHGLVAVRGARRAVDRDEHVARAHARARGGRPVEHREHDDRAAPGRLGIRRTGDAVPRTIGRVGARDDH